MTGEVTLIYLGHDVSVMSQNAQLEEEYPKPSQTSDKGRLSNLIRVLEGPLEWSTTASRKLYQN